MSEPDKLDRFVAALMESLQRRYVQCPYNAAPDTILLAVLNAVHDANIAVAKESSGKAP